MRLPSAIRYRPAVDYRRSAGLFFAASLLLFIGTACAQPVPPELCLNLEQHGDLATLPDTVQALQLIYRLESVAGDAKGKLAPNPGMLSKGPRTLPTDVVSKSGYYVGVTQAGDEPRYVYLVRLADPSYTIGEAPDPKGDIEGYVFRQPGAVLSTRVPFIPGGRLVICRVLAGKRTVILNQNLGPSPFPASGMDFKRMDR